MQCDSSDDDLPELVPVVEDNNAVKPNSDTVNWGRLLDRIPSFEWINTKEFYGDDEDHIHALQVVIKCEGKLQCFRRKDNHWCSDL